MNSILIVGVESIAGAGLATALSSTHRVTGISSVAGVALGNCRIAQLNSTSAATIEQQIQSISPDRIIFCGKASRSSWDHRTTKDGFDDALAVDWASAAARHDIDFALISSDAVFSGPWMSHSETDEHFNSNEACMRLRRIEDAVLQAFPKSLIVRTNVFGWSPCRSEQGFAEQLLDEIRSGLVERVDFIRHASPVLATDLGALIEKAFDEEIHGALHLAGAERLSPYQFAERLCAAADQSAPIIPDESLISSLSSGQDRRETTLDCSAARELLGVSMPLLEDGLTRFLAQQPDRTESNSVARVSVAGAA